jgi:hypothetical protein
MAARWQFPLILSALSASLIGGPFSNTAHAQCSHGGGSGFRSSQGSMLPMMMQQRMLQQQMLTQQMLQTQQTLQQQQLEQQQLLQTVQVGRALRDLIAKGPEAIKVALRDSNPQMRQIAALAAGKHGSALANDLIERLTDDNASVRQAARRSLVNLGVALRDGEDKLTSGRRIDFGPAPDANQAAQKVAARKWSEWFDQAQGKTSELEFASVQTPPVLGK